MPHAVRLTWFKSDFKFTYEDLSTYLGISRALITRWLQEKAPIPPEHYDALLRLFIAAAALQRQGKDPRSALQAQPQTFTHVYERRRLQLIPWSPRVPAPLDLPPDLAVDFAKARGDDRVQRRILFVALCRILAPYAEADPLTLTFSADMAHRLGELGELFPGCIRTLLESEAVTAHEAFQNQQKESDDAT